MSQAEGLSKLTEYLKQTKRQAEAAVDHLNKEISRLSEENGQLKSILRQTTIERDEYFATVEELKMKNTSKYKLKERDDWKNLVDQIQVDRTRLQEENSNLEERLAASAAEMQSLMEQLQSQQYANEQLQNELEIAQLPPSGKSPSPITPRKELPHSPLPSPNKLQRQGSSSKKLEIILKEEERIPPITKTMEPENSVEEVKLDTNNVVLKLKQLLQTVYNELKACDNVIIDTIITTIEFKQLRLQFNDYNKKLESDETIIHPYPNHIVSSSAQAAAAAAALSRDVRNRRVIAVKRPSSWLEGLFSFFSSSSSTSASISVQDHATYIIKV